MRGSSGKETSGIEAPSFDGSQPCAQLDPELFFPEEETPLTEIQIAINVCKTCEFEIECLRYAVKNSVQGIWGGTTDKQRRSLKRGRKFE